MQPLTVSDIQTVAGAAILVALIVEVVKRAGQFPPATVDRFGPLFACLMGVAIVVAATLGSGTGDIGQAALTGLLGGASAMGLSDAVGSVTPSPAVSPASSAPGEEGYTP